MTLRPLSRADFPLLARWLSEPHVARWWAHDTSPTALEADFGAEVDGTSPTELYIARIDQRPIGLIQRYRLADYPPYLDELCTVLPVPDGAFGIDYFIGEPSALRQGWGTAMIKACVDATWRDWPDARVAIVAVHADNEASWRVLRCAGFTHAASGMLQPDNPVDDRRHELYRLYRPPGQRAHND